MSVNKVILVGRLGRDPETRFTGGGQPVCNYSVATDENFKSRSGERQKRTEWHKIVVWGKLAEISQQYLKKGTLVYIEGRLQTRQWDDKQGQKKTTTEVVANVMRMLSSRGDNAAAAAAGAGMPPPMSSGGGDFDVPMGDEGGGPGPEISDEDIPF
jgi:single-strand DNA-binding protein